MDDFRLTSPTVVTGRSDLDFFPTPRWCTEALLCHLQRAHDWWWWNTGVREALDPACGEGAILDVCRERGKLATLGYELDPGRAEAARQRGHQVGVGDALERDWTGASLCVMNPPYLAAEAFVRKALAWRASTQDNPPIFALLRLSWLEPAGTRGELLRAHPPDVLILPRRPAFDGRGTDSITSAWFCWPGTGRLVWLP